jgi:hypothetical protein
MPDPSCGEYTPIRDFSGGCALRPRFAKKNGSLTALYGLEDVETDSTESGRDEKQGAYEGSVMAMTESGAKRCQVSGRSPASSARIANENRVANEDPAEITHLACAPLTGLMKRPAIQRRSRPQTKETCMTSKYLWRGVLTVVLGAALAHPAAAQIGGIPGPLVLGGPFVAQIVEAIAAAVFIALVFIHELSVILGMCSLASPLRMQSGAAAASSVSSSYTNRSSTGARIG